MTTAMLASVLAALVLSFVAVFQILLAVGLPLGKAAWGGTHRVLPPAPPSSCQRLVIEMGGRGTSFCATRCSGILMPTGMSRSEGAARRGDVGV